MRILIAMLFLIVSLCLGGVSFAGKKGGGHGDHHGPSERAYERANENAAFKRTKDWEPGKYPDKPRKKRDHDGEHKEKKLRKGDKDDDRREDKDSTDQDHAGSSDHDNDDMVNDPLTNQTGS